MTDTYRITITTTSKETFTGLMKRRQTNRAELFF